MVASDGILPGTPIVFRCRKWARNAAQNCDAALAVSAEPVMLHANLLPALAHFVRWLLLCTIQHVFRGCRKPGRGPSATRVKETRAWSVGTSAQVAVQAYLTSHCRVAFSRLPKRGDARTQCLKFQAYMGLPLKQDISGIHGVAAQAGQCRLAGERGGARLGRLCRGCQTRRRSASQWARWLGSACGRRWGTGGAPPAEGAEVQVMRNHTQ